MSSWVTVKDSEEAGRTNGEHQDVEPAGELGIFKLRSTYTRALSALHGSEKVYDADWCESRAHFEEIVSLAESIMDETSAARSECTLLQFAAYSNLSRMLSRTEEKRKALNNALDAASVFSVRYGSVHDPGLLLRIARLTLDVGDLWSCEQLFIHGVNGNTTHDSGAGCLLDSFYQLNVILQRRIASSSLLDSANPCDECEIVSLQQCASSSCTSIHDSFLIFNKFAATLASKDCLESSDYSFTSYCSYLAEAIGDDITNQDLSVFEVPTVEFPALNKLVYNEQELIEIPSSSVTQNSTLKGSALPSFDVIVLEGVSTVNAKKQNTETREMRSNPNPFQDQKSQSENIGTSLTRRKKENQNASTTPATRLPALQVNFMKSFRQSQCVSFRAFLRLYTLKYSKSTDCLYFAQCCYFAML